MSDPQQDRYVRQTIFPGIGAAGQKKISAAKAVVVGCGALGSSIANLLARAGVGRLVIADRDFVELSNLQRQVLFDEEDIDLDFLARRFKLSGGDIRNICVAAGYLAAAEDRPLSMGDLIRATEREYQKLGRLTVEAEFGKYLTMTRSGG